LGSLEEQQQQFQLGGESVMQTRTSIRRSRGAFCNIRKLPLAAAVALAFAAPVWAQSATEQAPASKEASKD